MKATYEIDPAHSSVQFSVRHLMVTNVRGAFTGVKGSVSYDPADPTSTTVHAVIDTSSINTNDSQRDTHLKSADFLEAEKYPTMTFDSTSVRKTGDNEFKVTGNLTLHGETRPVELNVEEVSEEAKDPWGNVRIGVAAKTKVKRSDFGLNWNAALETGGVLVGDDVKIEFDLQFKKAQVAAA